MLKISLVWFITVMSSPLLVGYYEDVWRVAGWMAIGEYNFDLYDGFLRSFYLYKDKRLLRSIPKSSTHEAQQHYHP